MIEMKCFTTAMNDDLLFSPNLMRDLLLDPKCT